MKNQCLVSANNSILIQIEALKTLTNIIDDNFLQAVELIKKCHGKVIVSGMGKSGHIGNKIAATLASTGTPAFFLHPSEASHGDLGMITKHDILILISNSGESKELFDIINFAKRFNINIIGITSKIASTLAKSSDVALVLPPYQEANLLNAPTTSTTLTLVLGDALAMSLLEEKKFNQEQYKIFHPGGKIGASLLNVADIMRTNKQIPLVQSNQNMQEVLLEMTSKHLGCTGVLENEVLVGIITDGDLRRSFCANFLQKTANQIMTFRPIVISADILAIKAVALMNQKSITSVFVVDDLQKPSGILHLHDCLKAGII
jgi:arabinose-5-phosphate isomerase